MQNKMTKSLSYLLLLPLLAACTDREALIIHDGEGILVLSDLSREQTAKTVLTTRNAIDSDLAVELLAADGNVYRGYQYAAGAVIPDKFDLIPATYTLHAFSENEASWQTDNDGRGSAVYDVRQPFEIQADWVTYLNVSVPMINYGVTYSVPDGFSAWFPTCEFTVTADGRTCPLTSEQIAYFDPENIEGFTFTLHLVNSDGDAYNVESRTYANPKAGLLYNVTYTFASDDDPTKLKIGISYDDTYEELVSEITLY